MSNRKQTCAHNCKQKQWPRCDSHVFYRRGTSVGAALFDRDSQAVAFRAAYFSFQLVYLSIHLISGRTCIAVCHQAHQHL
jgi:hypothetical protein